MCACRVLAVSFCVLEYWSTLTQPPLFLLFSFFPLILFSTIESMLSFTAESLVALIYPFQWTHVYVPVLPSPLLDYIQVRLT